MSLKRGYAVGGFDGPDMFFDGADFGQAVDEAQEFFPESSIYFDGDIDEVMREDQDMVLPNPRPGKATALKAFRACGLPRLDVDRVMALTVRRAHCRVAPFFKYLDGCPIQSYGNSSSMAAQFLGENTKLAKGRWAKLPRGANRGVSRGLALMPHTKALEFSDLPLPMKAGGLCVGSSRECRQLCLLYSGQNPIGDKLGPGKLRKVEALLTEPEAFMRMMIYAAGAFQKSARKGRRQAYLRLNILSDIPWELVFPEFFDIVKPVRCYDYTKVEGREMLDNYDLTFSFNGHNWAACEREMARGVRSVVVFWHDDKKTTVTDFVFNGYPVEVNCDPYDFRPLDPGGVLCGLTYRPPLVEGEKLMVPPRKYRKFVVAAFRDTDTGVIAVPQVPANTGASVQFKNANPKLVG